MPADKAQASLLPAVVTANNTKAPSIVTDRALCTTILNDTISDLQSKILLILGNLNRSQTIPWLMKIATAVQVNRTEWHLRMASILSLYPESQGMEVATDVDVERAEIILAIRALIEMGVCACSDHDGCQPSLTDTDKLIALAIRVIKIAQYNDAIHYGLEEAKIELKENGSLLLPKIGESWIQSYYSDNYAYGLELTAGRRQDDVKLEKISEESELNAAVLAEWGLPLAELGEFWDALDEMSFLKKDPILIVRRSSLFSFISSKFSALDDSVNKFLDDMTLLPRSNWNVAPEGYSKGDIEPWRLERRWSLLRRPIVQINDALDPTLGRVCKLSLVEEVV
jgi:hypothetical protein